MTLSDRTDYCLFKSERERKESLRPGELPLHFALFAFACFMMHHLGVFSTSCTFARKEKASLKLLDWKLNIGWLQAMFFFAGKHYHDNCFYYSGETTTLEKKWKTKKSQNKSQTPEHPLLPWTYHKVLLVIIEANCTTSLFHLTGIFFKAAKQWKYKIDSVHRFWRLNFT